MKEDGEDYFGPKLIYGPIWGIPYKLSVVNSYLHLAKNEGG